MVRSTRRRRWTARALTVATAALGCCVVQTMRMPAARAAGADPASPAEEKKPAGKPVDAAKPDAGSKPADASGELIRPVGPATAPATQPGTRPAGAHAGHKGAGKEDADEKPELAVTPEVRALLDKVRDAYQGLQGLKLAGTLTGEFDLNGERQTNKAEFTSAFRSAGQFRHELRELSSPDGAQPVLADKPPEPADVQAPATKPAAGDTTTVGANGKKLYVYYPRYNYYYQNDVPGERTGEALGKTVNGLLSQQNLSLLLAVVADASAELLDGPDQVDKVPDVTVGGDACPALKLTLGKELVLTVAFDPKTSLVRQAVYDYRGLAEAKKQQDVKAAQVTVAYTTSEPAADADATADLKPEAFAWAAPVGARDMTASADGGGSDGDGADTSAEQLALIGKPAPDFKLPGADGKMVKLSDLKGHVVLLDFWATWCGPCVESLPHLDEIYDELKDKGLKAYAVNLREAPDGVKSFVEQSKLKIPVLFDKDGAVAKLYAVNGIPQTVVIDKSGKVAKLVVGGGTHDEVRAAIEQAMK